MKSTIIFVASVGILLSSGCGSSRKVSSPEEEMKNYESEFNPSEYNPDVQAIIREEVKNRRVQEEKPGELLNAEPAELVSGFRVQIFSSTNIDDAAGQKEAAEALFPEESFYLVYDAPTYKLRGGNFLTRFEADNFLRNATDRGFRDSWIVPDRVYKVPPPKSPRPPSNPR